MVHPPTITSNSSMPFSVTDILQPLDIDASSSYKRSLEMVQVLAASSSSAYSTQRPSSNTTSASLCNPTFGPDSSYYGPSSTTAFSPNNQYYDYSASFQNGGNSSSITGQYSPSSCWYGSAASKSAIRL
jgi:hypothetical protein